MLSAALGLMLLTATESDMTLEGTEVCVTSEQLSAFVDRFDKGEKELPSVTEETVIEYLQFQMPPSTVDEFVALDERLWTDYLRQIPGYLSKRTSHVDSGTVELWVWWESLEALNRANALPGLSDVYREFDDSFQKPYHTLPIKVYQVCLSQSE
ncbi:Uncharacterised protein [BD1-7 clade bacterium]|uniref:ABM domain-containing protein n=1 Tax=BD1-7 clade bacterium TaxID=2029982 RepID=A0A5S9NLQ9_9GAMM|nr:Uncharacterised protein [BD1-7 clade bacterium]CAA0093727.1 Uncharacterised protein [BD1-7 clade bacterium]